MKVREKFLTIEEKRQLVLEGKPVPVCTTEDYVGEKRRKRQQKKLAKTFAKNVL